MDIMEKIIELRKSKGLTQSLMAEKLGIAPNNYGKIEKGHTELSVSRLNQIADILNVSLSELLIGEKQATHNEERLKELEVYLNHWKELAEERGKKNKSLEKSLKGITEILLEELEERAFLWIQGTNKEDHVNVKSLKWHQLITILKVLEPNQLCQFYLESIRNSPLLVYAINENLLGEEGEIIKDAINDMVKEMLDTFEHQNTDTLRANIDKIKAKLDIIINEDNFKKY